MNLALNLKAIVGQRLIPLEAGKGRAAAIEVMLNSSTVADYIFKQTIDPIREVMIKSREQGMQTFDQSLFELYEAGKISYEEALKNADSLNDVKMRIKLDSKRASAEGVGAKNGDAVTLRII
jgi:twitching motility protein PilU